MSADSPRRGIHKGLQIISPQPVSDKSIIDSVAGIINDIVPQAYSGGPNLENKESITWARFEYADINDPSLISDYVEGSSTPPLLLVLGYSIGVQVWLISASGEATSVLSWRQNVVRTLRILPNPKSNEDSNESIDMYEQKRPLIAICDSTGTGLQFCNVNFISLKTGEQLKTIKFKNPVCDVLANKRSIVVTFLERIAVFDAKTFEDILTVTTCYPSPGPNPNPVALGTRWLAYSEKKLIPTRRSSGGSEGEGVQSYTATVLYAAKSLGKGLRGLGETVASSLTGNSTTPMTINNTGNDVTQPGVVTILDLQSAKREKELDDPTIETVVAHFTAHNDAIVAMKFDSSGSVLMTADKRGHDFHIFKIQPHPGGPTLAAVHHLYVLHRGDTTAKVQDMVFSSDTRWAAVSTVRGTTHVFPVAPYGGPVGMRTHSTAHVVNRLSRFHKSAGLTDDGTRSHSPVSHNEMPISVYPYSNPRLPPYPHPTIIHPLAQIRQPSTLNHVNNQSQQNKPQRQRLHSDDNGGLPLKICACFAPARAWIYNQRDSSSKSVKKTIDSLFIMACHGNMIQYDLEAKPATGIPKEKICDDTMIELEVEAKGQWPLLRTQNGLEIIPPLSPSNPLLCFSASVKNTRDIDTAEDRWLSQVEIVTHAGPHRRLWMGPQFVFKTYNASSGANVVESEAVEIGVIGSSRPARSNPVNMPHTTTTRPLMPVIIDGSGSSYEQSPRFIEAYGDSLENDGMVMGNGENQLREDLAEAMLETSTVSHQTQGRRLVVERVGQPVTKVVNPLGTVITIWADEEDATSSLEFDESQESIPESRKSICAEVGPTSFNDFDSEGIPLPTLTEICAEMRPTNEPIIDNIPDENIKDIKEEKTLCVEPSSINTCDNAIDFEKEEAFHDISTNLSLCVEKGEIPNSPMSQARENWSKFKMNEKACLKNAKYVVNYDDENVVLMENKTTKPNDETYSQSSDFSAKYLLHEHEDSVVIEDTSVKSPPKNKILTKVNNKKMSKAKKLLSLDLKDVNEKKLKNDIKPSVDSFVELKDTDILVQSELINSNLSVNVNVNELIEPMEATAATASGFASLPSDQQLPFDDINCMDYHIVETNVLTKDSVQSDDDIEHINDAEITMEPINSKLDCASDNPSDVSPKNQRKNSKSAISDDDIEHINPSELTEIFEKVKDIEVISQSDPVNIEEIKPEEPEKISPLNKPNKSSRKRKDVVIIDSEPSNEEVTVIVKSLDKDSVVNNNRSNEVKKPEETSEESQSLPRKTRVKTSVKNSVASGLNFPKPSSSNVIEIIDIDAMQKAEMDVASSLNVTECKIVDSCQELITIGRMKKKRNKDGVKNDDDSTKGNCSKKENVGDCNYKELNDDLCKLDDDKLSKKCVQNEVSISNVLFENSKVKKISSPNDQCSMISDKCLNKGGIKLYSKTKDRKNDGGDNDVQKDKDCELNQEETTEKSSSSDDSNVNIVPMDTEDDCGGGIKDNIDKTVLNNEHPSPSWSTVNKKANRSKKKKRR